MPLSTILWSRLPGVPGRQTGLPHAGRGLGSLGLCWLALIVCQFGSPAAAETWPSRLPAVDQVGPAGTQLAIEAESRPAADPYYAPETYPSPFAENVATGQASTGWYGPSSFVAGPRETSVLPTSSWDRAACKPKTEDFDLDSWTDSCDGKSEAWTLQVMPLGLLYRSYLAGVKEPRFASTWTSDSQIGDVWDSALGGRLGLLRYGTQDPVFPEGWQVDLEGGSQARLDPHDNSNALLSDDFRVGIPVTYACGRWQFKTGYYHISSHLGDEFLLMNPGARRLNYTRDSIMLAVGFFCTERLRLYGETAYALSANDGAEPLEFQFGFDWAPARDTGLLGAPFLAANGHLREDVDFGGNLVLQAGWSWRRYPRGSLFRLGVQYYKGKSEQYEYFDFNEERFGWGLWADF